MTVEVVAHQAEPGPRMDPFSGRGGTGPLLDESDGPKAFDPAQQQRPGAIIGMALACYRVPTEDGQSYEERFLNLPGDDVTLTFPTVGMPPDAVSSAFTIVDFYESKMSDFDSRVVFVPIRVLQENRGMIDPTTGKGHINSIQIKLHDASTAVAVRDELRKVFLPQFFVVQTWRDQRSSILDAVEMETAILNVLLFLIIAVAGFGILAIFLMIVVEKTRDIGILKSLGASRSGIMGIFLSYGLALGVVGSGVGLVLGLVFVAHINEIAGVLGRITGRPVFDPTVYYFYEIPTIVETSTVLWIVAGAVTIAVLASVLPALRAALLHPVEALRYE